MERWQDNDRAFKALFALTFLGVIFIPITILFFCWRPSYLVPLAVVASPFEAGSVFNGSIGDFPLGVSPFFLVEVCILLRLLLSTCRGVRLLPPRGDLARPIVILLCWFWLWSTLSAFVMPHLFAGITVEPPRLNAFPGPLEWTLSNLAQALYLTLSLGCVLYASQVVRTEQETEHLVRAFYWAVFIAVAVGLAQSLAIALHWEFPYEAFNNNQAYSQGFEQEIQDIRRINSTFLEPSFAGSFLSAAAVGLMATFLGGRRGLWWLLAILSVVIVLLQTTATTGLAALAAMLCLLLIVFNPFRNRRNAHHSSARTWIAIGMVFLILGLVLYLNPDLSEALVAMTVEKMGTLSFWGRLISDFFGMTIFVNTYGLGSGLGSSRSSSLITTLLSTVGIVGTALFGAVLYRIIRLYPGKQASASLQMSFWAFFGLVMAHSMSIPDLNRPALWALMILLVVQLNMLPGRTATTVEEKQPLTQLAERISRKADIGTLPAS